MAPAPLTPYQLAKVDQELARAGAKLDVLIQAALEGRAAGDENLARGQILSALTMISPGWTHMILLAAVWRLAGLNEEVPDEHSPEQ